MNIQEKSMVAGVSDDPAMRLDDAYELWLQCDHPGKAGQLNRDRGQTDLLNYKRALTCFAIGVSNGTIAAQELPLTALEVPEQLVARHVIEGVSLLVARGRSKPPTKKTLSNLVSCLRAIRTAVFADKHVPVKAKSTRKRLAELPKRRNRIRFPKAHWPTRFAEEWQRYRRWKTKLLLTASEGASYRRTVCRFNTIDKAHVSNINPYVGFLVRERDMDTFGLVEVCNPELFKDFINWHLSQDADGGYVFLKRSSAVMATLGQYLVATGQLSETTNDRKLWDVFYDIGRDVMSLGAERGHISFAPDVGTWKPRDLRVLGQQGWNFVPLHDRMTSPSIHANAIFNRKRTALFFYLACETPLRARNWLEMKWGKSLLRMPDGRWRVFFKGDELKIGRRGYVTNVYEVMYSEDASRQIDLWREVLSERFGPDFENITPHVLPPNSPNKWRSGAQLSYGAFSQGVKSLVMELRGEAFHPHKIRYIVGSYLVNERRAGGLGLAAKLLGDTPQVILDAYYRPNTTRDLASYVSSLR